MRWLWNSVRESSKKKNKGNILLDALFSLAILSILATVISAAVISNANSSRLKKETMRQSNSDYEERIQGISTCVICTAESALPIEEY